MKRRDVIKRIAQQAKTVGVEWTVARKGANHEVYRLGTVMVPIPRHNEIGQGLTEAIFKECELVFGERWWK